MSTPTERPFCANGCRFALDGQGLHPRCLVGCREETHRRPAPPEPQLTNDQLEAADSLFGVLHPEKAP